MPDFDKKAFHASIEAEMTRQNVILTRICQAVRRLRSEALTSIMEENRACQRTDPAAGKLPGRRYGLTEPAGALALAIWDRLTEDEKVGLTPYRGRFFYERHSWFVLEVDSAALECPRAVFIIDPAPRGVGFWVTTPAELMIVHPGSPLMMCYDGEPWTGEEEAEASTADEMEGAGFPAIEEGTRE